ncbi:hypothetical protein CWO89_01870 [Bradyrhizobium sp. Leo170]|nr:hypothetical protein CWO89_01870 [Bradyrhizobium sp. Leo170]
MGSHPHNFFGATENFSGNRKMTEKTTDGKKRARSRKKPALKKVGGRPAWKPSVDERTTIERMKFCGESDATIARSLGVDVDTMRKHCPEELASGYANRRREVINLLFEAAKAKNTSAIKRLDDMGRASGAAAAVNARGAKAAPEAKEPAPEKLGKKEQRKQAAQAVVGKFAPPEPPKLVVNNDAG